MSDVSRPQPSDPTRRSRELAAKYGVYGGLLNIALSALWVLGWLSGTTSRGEPVWSPGYTAFYAALVLALSLAGLVAAFFLGRAPWVLGGLLLLTATAAVALSLVASVLGLYRYEGYLLAFIWLPGGVLQCVGGCVALRAAHSK